MLYHEQQLFLLYSETGHTKVEHTVCFTVDKVSNRRQIISWRINFSEISSHDINYIRKITLVLLLHIEKVSTLTKGHTFGIKPFACRDGGGKGWKQGQDYNT